MVAADNLVVNLDKTSIMKFTTKNSSHSTLYVGYKEELIAYTGDSIYKISLFAD
jgi:hypothetical protein